MTHGRIDAAGCNHLDCASFSTEPSPHRQCGGTMDSNPDVNREARTVKASSGHIWVSPWTTFS
jgi:hypothetical protein